MTDATPTKADLVRDLQRLDAARGVLVAALQTPEPSPEVLALARRRAAGHVRVLVVVPHAILERKHGEG
jgi:hypothetical protein